METHYTSTIRRARLEVDTDAECPLSWHEHGAQFITLPDPSRTYCDYTDLEQYSDTYTSVPSLEYGSLDNYREWWDTTWREPYQTRQTAPSFATLLDRNCAAWGTVNRNGYDGTLSLQLGCRTELTEDDAVILVSRATFKAWHLVRDGKPMPRGYRTRAQDTLRGIVDEYNAWAVGDVYGIVTEEHDAQCPYCEDAAQPDPDCACWDQTDSVWGFVGYDYAMDALTSGGY